MQHFLDVMQSCYQDGTESTTANVEASVSIQLSDSTQTGNRHGNSDYRWFSGLYFIFRIVFLAVVVMSPNWFAQFILQQFLCTGAFLCFALFRPYKRNAYNALDCVMFSILPLGCINVLNIYAYHLIIINESSFSVLAFQYFLIFCPFVYMTCYVIYQMWKARRGVVEFFVRCCGRKEERSVALIDSDILSN